MRNKSSEVNLLIFLEHSTLCLNKWGKSNYSLSSSFKQSRIPFKEMYEENNSKLIACKPSKVEKSSNCREKKPNQNTILTGKDRREEDVVGKRNESTFSKRIEYAVLIGKLLSFLG